MHYDTAVVYDPKANEEYDILSVEQITTRNGLQGVRVEMVSKNTLDKRDYGVTLWPSSPVSSTSKWGAFISALGTDTDVWIGQRIRILGMETRKCEIAKVVETKKSKQSKLAE